MIKTSLFIIALAAAAHAADAQGTRVKQAPAASAAAVTYAGTQDGVLSVAVQYSNPPGQRFMVTVEDQGGYRLYEGGFTERSFNKTFRLARSGVTKLVFILRNTGTGELQRFEVKAGDAEAMAVKKVD